MQMKGKHEEIIGNFFNQLEHPETEEQFSDKISGYCLIYAPYYILFLETDDPEYHDFVLKEIQKSVG